MSNDLQSLPVMEWYETFQGEGFHQGKMAIFLRLQGCDVGCHWCDVQDSWEFDDSKRIAISEIITNLTSSKIRTVVITGGEPSIYNLTALTEELHKSGFEIHMETSGTNKIQGEIDWITFSPKKFKPADNTIYEVADELKVVINHPSDYQWAEQHYRKCTNIKTSYLQPEWSKSKKIIPEIVQYCKENPHWNISLQTHKYVEMP